MKILKITSKDNEKIKFLKKLKQKKYRDKHSKFFVENLNIIYDGLKADVHFESLFITSDLIKKNNSKIKFILSHANINEYYIIDEKINKSFSDLETPSGICAVYEKIIETGLKPVSTQPIIYLNGISDPGNLGTILRSALAFSLTNIVVDEHCADIYNYKTINAAKDAIFKVNIKFDKDLKILKEIKKKMPVFSTQMQDGKSIDILKKQKSFCMILGSEAKGVDKKIQNLSDGFIKIEMSDNIESLNVASAAAIIFYNIYENSLQ